MSADTKEYSPFCIRIAHECADEKEAKELISAVEVRLAFCCPGVVVAAPRGVGIDVLLCHDKLAESH